MMTDEEKKKQQIRNSEIWEMRLKGSTYREIAKKYRLSIPRVSQIVKDRKSYEFWTAIGNIGKNQIIGKLMYTRLK